MKFLRPIKSVLLNNHIISSWAHDIKTKQEDRRFSEKKKTYGLANPNKTIYVIRRRATNVGLLSIVIVALARMKEAEERGFVPVVDLCNYKNIYIDDVDLGKKNAWEFFFLQPSTVTLKTAYKSRHVVLSSGEIPQIRPNDETSFLQNNEELSRWRDLFRKYIHIRKEILDKAELEYKANVFPGQKVVGVCCRGYGYRNAKPKNHPIQPDVQDMIIATERMMKKHFASKVYLSTEDTNIIHEFHNAFQDRLFVKKREYVTYNESGKRISGNLMSREAGENYLIQLLLLSKCDCIVSARCSGLVGAELMTNGFEDQDIFDLGKY